MNYQIHITKTAEQDLNVAINYIEYVLKNPDAADHLLDLTEEKFISLSDNPKIHPLVDDPVLNSWGIRFVVINNYLAFYTINEDEKTVYIVRFLFCKRDWATILIANGSLYDHES